jgi:hypothetical protein
MVFPPALPEDRTVLRISQKNRSQLILIALVLALGILLAWWSVRQTDGVMRNALLQQASLAAKTISYRDIMTLAGNSADLKKPQYQRFKRQLAAVRQAGEKYRFVYLMGQRDDGTMFFYADSEPVGSRTTLRCGNR